MAEWAVALEEQAKLSRWSRKFKTLQDMRDLGFINSTPLTNSDEGGLAGEVGFRLLQSSPFSIPPYYFHEPCCRILEQAAPSYPEDQPLSIHSRAFLTDAGFWYFGVPVGRLPGFMTVPEGYVSVSGVTELMPTLRAVLWYRDYERKLLVIVGCREALDGLGPVPSIFAILGEGMTIRKAIEQVPGSAQDGMRFVLRFLWAGIAFCHQRIFLDRAERADRPTRRRAAALLESHDPAPDVHVITLRRPVAAPSSEEARDVDWQWRWWVRGHWRNQACGPERSERETIWISSHLKGPDDRPIKPLGTTVYEVKQ